MFLRPKESLRLSIYSVRRCVEFSNFRDFHLTHCTYLRKVSSGRTKTSDVRDYESSPSVGGEFSVNVAPKKVNDNFFGIETDEGVIKINSKPTLNNNAKTLFKNVEQEKLISTSFGTVRYDSENKPKQHGQLEKEKVLINSNVEKDKISNLSQMLSSKNSVENFNALSTMEKNSKTITGTLDGNMESNLPSSSYIDELYFPEPYTEKENNISRLENSPTSSNHEEVNFIEESYFNENTTTEPVFKNTCINSENISSTDKNHPLPVYEKSTEIIADEKQSSIFDEYYFNTISEGNIKNIEKNNLDSVTKIVDTIEKKSNRENSAMPSKVEKSKVSEKNLSINEPEVDMTDFQVTSKDSTFNTKNLYKNQETETKIKKLRNLNESIEEINADDAGGKLSLQWNNLSVEELEGFNKFLPYETHLPKKKNQFLFQGKEFLKESELKSSRLKNLISFRRNLDETDIDEKSQNKEEMVKSSQETRDVKDKKEANVKNSNANEQTETAYDFVQKLRSTKKKSGPELINGKFIQKSEEYDSKGFRVLKNQVPDLKYYTRDEILDLLVKNVLYSDDDLIVLNKPYNLVMHESKTAKDPCLSQYLDDLAAELDKKTYKPKLITVHRLDKETSGCLILARNEISAQKLLSLFSQRKIIKTYWIVTIKVPNPLEGVIDMSVSEGSVNGRARMVLHPDLPKDIRYRNHSKSGKRAVTHYKVIAESGNAALVEAKPETGIKHQIRVHFGFGLSCPILGDHKYSHLDKLVPQKLQSDLLQRLHVRQSKVRHIPMHIYARSIFIPQYTDERNLFVMAPMPVHMSKNLQKLKFKK